jgi:hypothetical protein
MEVAEVWEAIRSTPQEDGAWCWWGIPHDWKGLGPGTCANLCRLLQAAEEKLEWPESTTQVVMALLPKPGGGERTIGLTSGLYRLYMRVRKPGIAR